MASRYMRNERQADTLQSTGLVHEVYLRLVDVGTVAWRERAQFYAMAAQMMRRILVDAARARASGKRGGGVRRAYLDQIPDISAGRDTELIALDDALQALAELDPRKVRVIELRYFGGLSVEETAEALRISPRSVLRDWNLAKAWLSRELRSG